MNRLEQIVKSDRLAGKRVIVTGCGYRPVGHTFHDVVTGEPTHESIEVDGTEMKLNIGSAVAGVVAANGATVHMVSRSAQKLANLKEHICSRVRWDPQAEYSALGLLDEEQVREFVEGLPDDKPIYWVQSVGLGAGSYALKDDNPYIPLDKVPLELVEKEANVVLRSTHLMIQALLPRFRKQKETRVAIISSMSAIRGYSYGGAHCAAKGAIDRYANSAMLGLWDENIFLTTIRPGAVDTGMYDNPVVQEAVMNITDEYGCDWRNNGIRLMPPTAVGEAVNFAFTAPAHVPSINMVAMGQFPNEGS